MKTSPLTLLGLDLVKTTSLASFFGIAVLILYFENIGYLPSQISFGETVLIWMVAYTGGLMFIAAAWLNASPAFFLVFLSRHLLRTRLLINFRRHGTEAKKRIRIISRYMKAPSFGMAVYLRAIITTTGLLAFVWVISIFGWPGGYSLKQWIAIALSVFFPLIGIIGLQDDRRRRSKDREEPRMMKMFYLIILFAPAPLFMVNKSQVLSVLMSSIGVRENHATIYISKDFVGSRGLPESHCKRQSKLDAYSCYGNVLWYRLGGSSAINFKSSKNSLEYFLVIPNSQVSFISLRRAR